MMKNRKNQPEAYETRTYNIREISVDAEARTISGYAAVFDSMSEVLWNFREKIDKTAFSETDMTDTRALFNHDPNYLLARTSSGTLNLEVDERGLKYSFTVPDTSYGRDLITMMERGDVTQSSFGFTVEDDAWDESGDIPVRTIKKVGRLYDVSPVTYPAYPETSAAVRSLELSRQQESVEAAEEATKEKLDEAERILIDDLDKFLQ